MLDKQTKGPIKIIAAILGIILIWRLFSFDSQVYLINQQLKQDPDLSKYPYQFKVIELNDGIATMSSPRSREASALLALRAMFPELIYENDDSDTMIQAQKDLASIQTHAANIVKMQQDVEEIKWELDRWWLQGQGINIF